MATRTLRWSILLARIRIRIPLRKLFAPYMAGMFVSNLTPGKVGEPIKSYLLKKTAGISISKSLPSVFMEKIFDILSAVLLSLVGIVVVTLPENVELVLLPVIALYAFAVAAVLYVSARKSRIYWTSKKMMKLLGWLPKIKKLDKSLEGSAEMFNESMVKYRNAPVTVKNFTISMVIWIAEGIILYLCFLSVGINVDALVVISFLSIAALIGVTSLLPGGLGSCEVVMVMLFTAAYPLPVYAVTAAVFMERFFGFGINVIAGSLCMGSLRLHRTG